eukprot:727873-Rhodomonas_salina.1
MFLTVLLEEVICHGTFGGIQAWLDELLVAEHVPKLVEVLLNRIEEVFNCQQMTLEEGAAGEDATEVSTDLVWRCLRL